MSGLNAMGLSLRATLCSRSGTRRSPRRAVSIDRCSANIPAPEPSACGDRSTAATPHEPCHLPPDVYESMTINKSLGVTPTEQLLAEFGERSFLKLWTYPNPYKDDGKELCDLIAVFGDTVFIFFDRNAGLNPASAKTPKVAWERWKRRAIDAQISTAHGAERYVRSGRQLFLDAARKKPFPLPVRGVGKVHKLIVAHGAAEACKAASPENIAGSLGIAYTDTPPNEPWPFFLFLPRTSPVHVLDSHNLPIILGELDTVTDLSVYLTAKEQEIERLELVCYCGEEDYLARYLAASDPGAEEMVNRYIEPSLKGFNMREGLWAEFSNSKTYEATAEANRMSYGWDNLIEGACRDFLSGAAITNADLHRGPNPIFEMVKEPRHARRGMWSQILRAIEAFPPPGSGFQRMVTSVPRMDDDSAYVFLQLGPTPEFLALPDWQEKRRFLLELACGAAKLRMPNLKQVIGIGIEHPNYPHSSFGIHFSLLPCDSLTPKELAKIEQQNAIFNFFQTDSMISFESVTPHLMTAEHRVE